MLVSGIAATTQPDVYGCRFAEEALKNLAQSMKTGLYIAGPDGTRSYVDAAKVDFTPEPEPHIDMSLDLGKREWNFRIDRIDMTDVAHGMGFKNLDELRRKVEKKRLMAQSVVDKWLYSKALGLLAIGENLADYTICQDFEEDSMTWNVWLEKKGSADAE